MEGWEKTKGVRGVAKRVPWYIKVHISILTQICQYYGAYEVDPDERDAEPQPKTVEFVSKFIGKHLKGVATTPSIFEICMYADTVSNIQLSPSLLLRPGPPTRSINFDTQNFVKFQWPFKVTGTVYKRVTLGTNYTLHVNVAGAVCVVYIVHWLLVSFSLTVIQWLTVILNTRTLSLEQGSHMGSRWLLLLVRCWVSWLWDYLPLTISLISRSTASTHREQCCDIWLSCVNSACFIIRSIKFHARSLHYAKFLCVQTFL